MMMLPDVDAIVARARAGDASARVLVAEPLVLVIDDFLRGAETVAFVSQAAGGMEAARVSTETGGRLSDGRTNEALWINHDATPALLAIAERMAALTGLPLSHAENFQLIHYGPGAEYQAHFDAFEHDNERGVYHMRHGGQRLLTLLAYLNPVIAGGATSFQKLDLSIDPVPGRLLLFANCPRGTNTQSPLSLHAGEPVTAGEKWAVNLWFRERKVRG